MKILVDNLDNRGTGKAVGKNENSYETGKPENISEQPRQPRHEKRQLLKNTRLELDNLDNLTILVDIPDNRGMGKAVGKNKNSSETGQAG